MSERRQRERGLTIAVAAGKGGTGKTLVATSLAVALAQAASRAGPGWAPGGAVQLLDCDVEEPNADLLLQPRFVSRRPVSISVPQVSKTLCTLCGRCAEKCQFSAIAVMRDVVLTFPDLCSGCGLCAEVCPEGAISEVPREIGVVDTGRTEEGIELIQGRINVGEQRSGPVTKAVKAFIEAEATSILDAPPGTACPMQETVSGSDYCLLVTEPTPFGLSDLKAAVETCRSLGVPCGVIVNRDQQGGRYGPLDDYCGEANLPVLLRVPEKREIAESYARGLTLARAFPEWGARLRGVYSEIEHILGLEELKKDAIR